MLEELDGACSGGDELLACACAGGLPLVSLFVGDVLLDGEVMSMASPPWPDEDMLAAGAETGTTRAPIDSACRMRSGGFGVV